MALTAEKHRNELSIHQHQMGILVGARLRETRNVAAAKKIQDDLRKKIGRWQGAEEIKKWRTRHN